MNAPHIHLLLNHVPILGPLFGLLVLIAAALLKSEQLKKTAFVVFVLSALVAIPVYLTGEPAEESVEGLAGLSEGAIEAHEENALTSFIACLVLGAVALLGFVGFRKRAIPLWYTGIVAVFSVIVSVFMGITANSGGKIRHPEIVQQQGTQLPEEEEEEHE